MISAISGNKAMARQQAEWSNALSVFSLKKYGYLEKGLDYKAGTMRWSYNGVSKSSVSIAVRKTQDGRMYLSLNYTHTSSWDGEKSYMDFDIELTTTPCNLGGVRYWFICPLSKRGVYCGRRVGVIYAIGKWFGCRHCGDIAYQSQFEGGKFRVGSVCEPDVEKAYYEIKRFHYKGKPTRRYKRYLRLRGKMDNSWARIGMKYGFI